MTDKEVKKDTLAAFRFCAEKLTPEQLDYYKEATKRKIKTVTTLEELEKEFQ